MKKVSTVPANADEYWANLPRAERMKINSAAQAKANRVLKDRYGNLYAKAYADAKAEILAKKVEGE